MNTVNCFNNLIVLENFFCINRSYLIADKRKRILGNIIFIVTSVLMLLLAVNDVITSNASVSVRMFQAFLTVQFVDLAFAGRLRKSSFNALTRLDDKCRIEDEYVVKLTANSTKYALFLSFSAAIDVFGLKVLGFSASEVVIYSVIFSAQDAELIFFSMIVEAVNLRLSKLKDTSPVFGSKVYRHVLVTTALLNEEFTPRLLLLLAVILGTTVTYSSVVMLSLTDTGTHLLAYLLWREMKTFFCLWRACYASSTSDRICQRLAFQLATTLALDPNVNKAKNPQGYSIVRRWYSIILAERPRVMSGSVMSIGLSVPLHLLDTSVNYVLIIVQIYVAYN